MNRIESHSITSDSSATHPSGGVPVNSEREEKKSNPKERKERVRGGVRGRECTAVA
jgi:hypothetical protein